MSILLANEIKKGNILIEPYNKKNLAINSFDVTLNKTLVTYQPIKLIFDEEYKKYRVVKDLKKITLDMKSKNKTYTFDIPPEGIILNPGILYLGSTNEKAGSTKFVPMYEGRSSIARLGIQTHVSAGFGDVGFQSNWTLEITVIHPVVVYPNVRIGQVYFHKINKKALKKNKQYKGKYINQKKATASQLYKDF